MRFQLQNQLQRYLKEVLGIDLHDREWGAATSFPQYLQDSYRFRRCELLDQEFLMLLSRDPELTPAAIEKHLDWVDQKTGLRGIYVVETLETYNRKRMIERKIPFIVPENQLYLPDLALDLREHLKKSRKAVEKLSPLSQVVVLSFLLGRLEDADRMTPTGLSKQFPYSKMSMSRSLDELRALKLVETQQEGRLAVSRFIQRGKALWAEAKPYLSSPVSKRIYLDELFHPMEWKAGESALEASTILGAPKRETWALTSAEWKLLQTKDYIHMIPEPSKDMAHAELEIWKYAPKLLSDGPLVDPLSLILSLGTTTDERVEMAIEELLDNLPW